MSTQRLDWSRDMSIDIIDQHVVGSVDAPLYIHTTYLWYDNNVDLSNPAGVSICLLSHFPNLKIIDIYRYFLRIYRYGKFSDIDITNR